jgi:hypothetical protein
MSTKMSTSPSALSLNSPISSENRASFTVTFTGNVKGIKTAARKFVEANNIFCVTGSFVSPVGNKSTHLYIEGEERNLYKTQIGLHNMLKSNFADAVAGDWLEQSSDTALVESVILTNPTPSVSRESSGPDVFAIENDVVNGKWRDFFAGGFTQAIEAAQIAHKIVSVAHSSASSIVAKDICVTHDNVSIHVNVGSCLVWNQFLTKICNSKMLKLKNIDLVVYDVDGGKKRYIDDVQLLKEGATYFVSYIAKQGFESMDDFYKAFESIVGWEKEDTEMVKKVFGVQRIKLSQLTSLTDAKLEKYGLIQGGLREAVLSVIENN